MSYIIFLGAPGSGKGTQAQQLSVIKGIPHLSTGNMLRSAIEAGSDVGLKAKAVMDAGNLVPDEVVVGIIKSRIKNADCANGFILDGFPRTLPQAQALDKMLTENKLKLDFVLYLAVNEDEIVKRQSGRLYAAGSGQVYHEIQNPPKVSGKCDISGEELVKREDDSPEVVRHRLKVYAEQTLPLKSYYTECGFLVEIDGMQAVEDVSAEIAKAINGSAAA